MCFIYFKKGRSQVTELKEAPSPQITTAPPAIQTVARPGIDSGLNDGLNPGMNSGIMNSGMSNAVREKLQELEKEIEKFREENIALHKLREEREKVVKLPPTSFSLLSFHCFASTILFSMPVV